MNQRRLYESAVAISRQRHLGWSVEPPTNYGFARSLTAVPLALSEFSRAALDHPVVFAVTDGLPNPVAVLGVGTNRCVAADGSWNGTYVPAYLRRYPFTLSDSQPGRLDVCVDETYPGFNQAGRGEPLLLPDGANTAYLDRIVAFLASFQGQLDHTRNFSRRLAQLSLLEPVHATIGVDAGKTVLTGFSRVSPERLKAAGGAVLGELDIAFGLEPVYAHLISLQRLGDLATRPR